MTIKKVFFFFFFWQGVISATIAQVQLRPPRDITGIANIKDWVPSGDSDAQALQGDAGHLSDG